MEKDAFPLLLILTTSRGFVEVTYTIEGISTPAEVLSILMESRQVFDEQLQRDLEEKHARETRENLKKQQEDEYNQSLQADLVKERTRKMNELKQKQEQDTNEQLKQKRLVGIDLVQFIR
jgi:acetyl/propionyl-CoA carboxylase alpha subunit